MEYKGLVINGTILSIIATIFVIIFTIKAFQANLFLAIFSIILCIGVGYFDTIIIKYFINKYNERKKKN